MLFGRAVYISAQARPSVRWLLRRPVRLPHGKDRKPAFHRPPGLGKPPVAAAELGRARRPAVSVGGQETQRVCSRECVCVCTRTLCVWVCVHESAASREMEVTRRSLTDESFPCVRVCAVCARVCSVCTCVSAWVTR